MSYNAVVELFRDSEYPMMKGKTYLDHGGTTIYAKSLTDRFCASMNENLYGNPHSASDPAHTSGQAVDEVRLQALAFFNADPEEFDLVFTANATAAIKLVAQSFQDLASVSTTAQSFWYGYHKDAHTSVVGVRELTKDTHHCFKSDDDVEDWLDGVTTASGPKPATAAGIPGLFAYPGQSNMTGRRLPLNWTKRLRDSTIPAHQNSYSLLDAAALATTTQLDLSDPDSAPDFTAVSFYKIFGFPDLGALIIRKDSGHILGWRKYFGGGTVNMITVLHESTVQRKDASLHDALEDGTLPFHSIVALGIAIDVHKKLYTSMSRISQHTSFLSSQLYHSMSALRHANGAPVCVIYTDNSFRCVYGDPKTQGATIAFNVLRADGSPVGYTDVETLANEKKIYLRSGGLCNAGGIATYLQLEPWQFKRAWSGGHRCGEGGFDILNGKPTGVVRASLGAMTTIRDIENLVVFLEEEFVEMPMTTSLASPLPTYEGIGQVSASQTVINLLWTNRSKSTHTFALQPEKDQEVPARPYRMMSSPEPRKTISALSVPGNVSPQGLLPPGVKSMFGMPTTGAQKKRGSQLVLVSERKRDSADSEETLTERKKKRSSFGKLLKGFMVPRARQVAAV